MRSHTIKARDAALRRLARVNRWLIAGSIALAGALTEVAAQAFPGRSTSAAAATGAKDPRATEHAHSAKPAGASSSTSSSPLHPPAQAPQATTESSPAQESAPAEAAPE